MRVAKSEVWLRWRSESEIGDQGRDDEGGWGCHESGEERGIAQVEK